MLRAAYRPGLFLRNNLLALYCRCGDMRHARLLFDGMPRRDAVSWNTLIAGYSGLGSCRLALDAFRDARASGDGVDRFTFAAALASCARVGDWRDGRVVHGLAVVSGLARTAFLTNSVIDMYAKCGMIDEVRLLFDRAEERGEASWNLLLSAYVRMGWPEVAVNVLVWMHRSGVKLDSFALGGILKACSELGDSEDVRRMLHSCVVKVGLDLDVFVGSAMVDMYAKNGGLEEAIKVFDCIPNQNVVVYNAMIAGFARLGNDPCPEIRIEAVTLFSNMLKKRIKPSKFTFKSVLEVCNLTNAVRCGRQIHAHVILSGLQGDEFIASVLINLYSKARCVNDSLRCFDMTVKEDVFIWTSMITAFVQNEHFEKALYLFRELLYTRKGTDQFTISSVMSACAALSVPTTCKQIHCHAVKTGLDQFTVSGNSQIAMYRNIGDLKASKQTFEQISCLDTFSWSAMILSYAVHGYESKALELFEKMKNLGVMMNESASLAALIACSHQGLGDEGLRYYENTIPDDGFSLDVKLKACMVDLLGRVGKIADAEDFIMSSGSENDPILWHALLRACRVHGDKERCTKIGEKLMELEPFSASSYVMLYNLYMDAGKISLAMRTRGLMRERGISNEAGISWTDFGGSIHNFIDGDNSCSHNTIHTTLEELLVRVKQKTEHGGTNIWELEFQSRKLSESSISRHGELLAVAFGLTTLPSVAPVRVMKNQRISWESHETLKLLSEGCSSSVSCHLPLQYNILLGEVASRAGEGRGSCSGHIAMIDDEADFGNITDATEGQAAAKFRPKARAKPRKTSLPSRSLAPHPTVESTDENVETLNKDSTSQEQSVDKKAASLGCHGSETDGNACASGGILDTPSEDVVTVSLGLVNNPDVALDSSTVFASSAHKVSQNEENNDDVSHVATHKENMVVSDTQAPPTCCSARTIDDLADFEGLCDDTHVEEERVAKFQPKFRVKTSKAASKSQRTNQKAGVSTVDVLSQNKEDGKDQAGCNDKQLHSPTRHQESVQISYSQAHLGTHNSTIDDVANSDSIMEEPAQEEMAAKFQPRLRPKAGGASPGVAETIDAACVATPEFGVSSVDVVSQDTEEDSHREGLSDDSCQKYIDEEAITTSGTGPPQDLDDTVDLDSHAEMVNPHPDGSPLIIEELSAGTTVKFQPYVRRKKGKGKSVSFVPPNVSHAHAPTDTNFETSNSSHFCKDIATGESLSNLPQQASEKICISGEHHPDDQECNDPENQYHEGEPYDHVIEQEPERDARETGTSMKLRNRRKLQKDGIPEHTADDIMDEDFGEPPSDEQDNDSGDEYTARGKQKGRRKSREKNINKEPSRGTKRTSGDSTIEESQKQKLQKNKSKASSGGQKKTSKDSSVEQPEKKLTHRIRRKRMEEVKTLLETPDHEIDRMKLSVTHLRLLQEAKERIKASFVVPHLLVLFIEHFCAVDIQFAFCFYRAKKFHQDHRPLIIGKTTWGLFGSNGNVQGTSQFGDMDDEYNEQDNWDNDRTENHVVENTTKLNYHSYMNRQTRAKWSKSETDKFYEGLQQFGSDFAMIQHLFPDKSRNQVRQKFKAEEKKHPMQVHDAIMHRSRDNLYFKEVIKKLNIEDVQPDINNTHEQEGTSNEEDPGNKVCFETSV
ncbi:Os03g0840400 [Oryza sativa Japonica Group]|uniref:Os03g0840400 protein n=1 Tax=Oryza sativa subsp. japonica TaxID=39947 RepID=C7J029_ORYSJ|nr:Os03g0840400 [Oryza sativa Japonica Group]|eukprot:NP_001173707.1 Os03g0840400 [Oryza sativa Japonica Group]